MRIPLLNGLALAALLALTPPQTAFAADTKASQFYEDALQRYEKKDMAGAVIQLRNALKQDKRNLSAQVLMGKALFANGEVNAAETAFEEAMKQGANPAEVVVPLAQTLLAQGKPDQVLSQARMAHAGLPADLKSKLILIKAAAASDVGNPQDALKFLEEARSLDANSADSWTAEVPIRVRARQLSQARSAANQAVALDPKSAAAAYQLASVLHVSGDLQGAVKQYTLTLLLKPTHVDALVARAGLYVDLNKIAEATTDVEAARKADPKDPRSAYLLALLLERAGRSAESKAALNAVTNLLDPYPLQFIRYRPQVLMLGGMSHFALGQYEKAKPYLEMVTRQDPNSPVSKLLAQVYLKEKRTDKAVEALEAYLKLFPNDRQAVMLLASSQMAVGNYKRSAQLMEDALKKTDDPTARTVLGISLLNSGKFANANTELEAAFKKDPGQIQAGASLVSLYIASDQGKEAVRVASALVKQQPNNPGLHNLLGSANSARGDVKAARLSFEKAISLDDKFEEPALNLARLDIDARAFDAALTRLNALLTKNEKHVDAAMETARLFTMKGQPDQALRWLQRADDNSGNRLQPGLQLVDFHLARGKVDMARDALRRLQGKAPEALLVLMAQARVQMAANELTEARSTLNRAASLVAYDAAALTQLAGLQMQADNLAGAAHALDKALAERPNHLRARALRSNIYLLQNEPIKAEQLARSVLASDPKSSLGHSLMGDVARFRNQIPAAVEAYRRAHELEQSSDSLLRLFGAMEKTQRPAAVATLEQWLGKRPGDVTAWRTLANSQARFGNMAAAKPAYEKLIALSPRDAEAYNNLTCVLLALGDASAQKMAEQALVLQPATPHIIGTAGWAAFQAGQTDRALQLLRDARLRDPSNPGTRYFLGTVLAKQGRKTEARDELQTALKSGPGFGYTKEAQALLRSLE